MADAGYVLLTGAAGGIGRAIAQQLSGTRRLLLLDRDAKGLEETRRLCSAPDSQALFEFDLKNIGGLGLALAGLLAERNLAVESFVHCAGITTVLPAKGINYQLAEETMTVNFMSALEITGLLLKKKVNGANLKNIIFISSIFGKFGARGHSLYCASKAALDGFMKALATELAPGVRVNSILPGGIRTRLSEPAMADPEIKAKVAQDYLLGLGEPADIAGMVEFLLSDKARWITGQQIIVDGGRTVNMSLK